MTLGKAFDDSLGKARIASLAKAFGIVDDEPDEITITDNFKVTVEIDRVTWSSEHFGFPDLLFSETDLPVNVTVFDGNLVNPANNCFYNTAWHQLNVFPALGIPTGGPVSFSESEIYDTGNTSPIPTLTFPTWGATLSNSQQHLATAALAGDIVTISFDTVATRYKTVVLPGQFIGGLLLASQRGPLPMFIGCEFPVFEVPPNVSFVHKKMSLYGRFLVERLT